MHKCYGRHLFSFKSSFDKSRAIVLYLWYKKQIHITERTESDMAERETKEDFGPKLVSAFESWVLATNGTPYTKRNQKEAMEKFQLTSSEFSALLFLTEKSWVF